jgi:iron complex transport system substrate-binding protein
LAQASSAASPRTIVLDWAVAETLVALGHPPTGCAEIPSYVATAGSRMPASVVDVGLRLAPNRELMQMLAPDFILINPAQEYLRPLLEPFCKVMVVPIYTSVGEPYRLAQEAALTLGRLFDDEVGARRLITAADAEILRARPRLATYDGRSLLALEFIDGKHAVVFGRASMFHGVSTLLGLHDAWTGGSNSWGVAEIDVEALVTYPEARVVYLTPLPAEARRMMKESVLWARLPIVRKQRVTPLPPLWAFGGLPSAVRFARVLANALSAN